MSDKEKLHRKILIITYGFSAGAERLFHELIKEEDKLGGNLTSMDSSRATFSNGTSIIKLSTSDSVDIIQKRKGFTHIYFSDSFTDVSGGEKFINNVLYSSLLDSNKYKNLDVSDDKENRFFTFNKKGEISNY